jgi:hypothetical protein
MVRQNEQQCRVEGIHILYAVEKSNTNCSVRNKHLLPAVLRRD